MDTRIVVTEARLDDDAAMEKFLAPIPNGEQLAKVLDKKEAISTRAYDEQALSARFVESDGKNVVCFTVVDITIDQAEMIAAARLVIDGSGEDAFREAVEQALGDDAVPVQVAS